MSKRRAPARPGNHFNQQTFWDTTERVIFYACVPIGAVTIIGMLIGLIAAAVTS